MLELGRRGAPFERCGTISCVAGGVSKTMKPSLFVGCFVAMGTCVPSLGFAEVGAERAAETAAEAPDLEDEGSSSETEVHRTHVRWDEWEDGLYRRARTTSFFSELDLQRAPDLDGLLIEVPGVSFQKTNVGAGSPLLRGRVGIENSIQIDGLRYQNSSFRSGPNQYLNVLDEGSFEGVAVLLGPGSLRYGSGATGGAINLRTHSGRDAPWGRARGKAASGDRSSSLSLDGGVAHGGTYFNAGAGMGSHGLLRSGAGGIVPASGFERKSVRLGLGTELGKSGWGVNGRLLLNETLHVNRSDQLSRGRARTYDNYDLFGYVDAVGRWSGILRSARVAMMTHRTDETMDRWNCDRDLSFYSPEKCANGDIDLFLSRSRYRDEVQTYGGKAALAWSFFDESWLLETGAEAYHDEVEGSEREDYEPLNSLFVSGGRGNFAKGARAYEWGVFAYSEGLLWQGTEWDFRLVGGVRFSGTGADAPANESFEQIAYSYAGASGEAGIEFSRGRLFTVHAGGASGYRSPNLQESTLVGDTGTFFEIPNGDLEPEEVLSAELGVTSMSSVISVGANIHHAWITDSIGRLSATFEGESVVDGSEVTQQNNLDSGTILGAEGWFRTGTWKGLGLFGDIAWVRMEQKEDGEIRTGRREPPVQGRGGVLFRRGDAGVRIFSVFALEQTRLHPSDRKDFRICEDTLNPGSLNENCTGSAGWATLNVDLHYAVNDTWQWDVGIANLTDNRYRAHGSGFDAMGANLWVSSTARF